MRKTKALGIRDTDMRIYGAIGVVCVVRLALTHNANCHNIPFAPIVENRWK